MEAMMSPGMGPLHYHVYERHNGEGIMYVKLEQDGDVISGSTGNSNTPLIRPRPSELFPIGR